MKKNKLIIYTVVISLILLTNISYFYIFYYPITKPNTSVTQNLFEKILLSGDIEEVQMITNGYKIEFKVKESSLEKYKSKDDVGGNRFELIVLDKEEFKNFYNELVRKIDPSKRVEIIYKEKNEATKDFYPKKFLIEVLIIISLLIINFTPSFIATRKSFFNQILALNLFLGWTFIGWVICLVWSLKKEN